MAKYIDAKKKLIAELRRQKRELELSIQSQGDYGQSCHIISYENIISLIESLQQEQPDFPTTDEQMKEFLATHPKIEVPEKYKNPDWLFKKLGQPEVDLEEAAAAIILKKHPIMKDAFTMEMAFYEMLELVKAGYVLGLNARKEENK